MGELLFIRDAMEAPLAMTIEQRLIFFLDVTILIKRITHPEVTDTALEVVVGTRALLHANTVVVP